MGHLAVDVLGRQRSDAVATLGTGVDGAVRRVETDYDALGRARLFTTYNAAAGGTIVNQVERVFNGFGQITAERQEHGGAVNTATSLKVRYDYAMANGGSRLVKMTYPTESRFLVYQYNPGIDDDISRLSAIADSAAGGGGVVESYKYLGLGTIIERVQPQIGEKLTYIRQPGDAAAAGDDRYSGLDRFGRVIDQNWVRTAASAGGAAGTSSVRLQYQYDRAGNALSRLDLVDAALSELYEYDRLDRLTSFQRGILSASAPGGPLDQIASPTLQQSWDLDALGNWEGVTTGGITTSREFNVGNQATSVSGGIAPTHDAVGNTTAKDGKEYKYDAWGRLASVKAAGGGSTLAIYTYDALGRRAVEHYPGLFATHVYFSPDWEVVEERTNDVATLMVLGATGQIVLRDVYPDGAPNEDWRYYARQNANGDVVALVKGAASNAGRVLERYAYEPYGALVVMAGDGSPRPGGTAHSWRNFFQGGRVDNVSGLYNFQFRDYDPSSGTWMTRDPIGLDSGDPNLYRFVANNPVNWTDPSGLIRLFGQEFVAPWDPRAGGVRSTLRAYGRATCVAAAGAGTGALTGGATGAVVGTVAPGPGTAAGAGAGALIGGIGGLFNAMFADGPAGAAKSGAISGFSGPVGGALGGGAARVMVAAGGSRIATSVFGGVAGGASTSAISQLAAFAAGGRDQPLDPRQLLIDAAMGGVSSVAFRPRTTNPAAPVCPATNSVRTPYGDALQDTSAGALAARAKVKAGANLYRTGTLGRSEGVEAQFWSLEPPTTPGFASRYGIPPENVANANFIEVGKLKPGTLFVTRHAPAVGSNLGGGIEIVVSGGGIRVSVFSAWK